MAFTARTETYFNAASLTSPFNGTVSSPTGTTYGDILFAIVCWYGAADIDAEPDGWTKLGDNTSNLDKYALYYKVAGTSEPASYTWSWTASAKVRIVCSCYTGGDFDPINPIDAVSNTAYRTSDAFVRAASTIAFKRNSPMVFWAAAYVESTQSFTKPSTPTTDWVEDDDTWHTDPDFANEICSMIWTGAGITGNMDATLTTSTTTKHAFAVVLNPAVVRNIVASSDDCTRDKGFDAFSLIAITLEVGAYSESSNMVGVGIRFTNVTVPKNAIIQSAKLLVVGYGTSGGEFVRTRISAEKADNPGTFTNDKNAFDARFANHTTARINWDITRLWYNDEVYTSPEIKTVLQEIVNRDGWQPGNAVVLFWEDFDNRSEVDHFVQGYSYDSNPVKTARLVITYSTSWRDVPARFKLGAQTFKDIPTRALLWGVTAQAATDIESTQLTVHGTYISPDGVNCKARGFEWGTVDGGPYPHSWVEEGDFAPGPYSYTITGLSPGQTIYYRAKTARS